MTLHRTYGWCRECGMVDDDHAGVYEANIVTTDGVLLRDLCMRCLTDIEREEPRTVHARVQQATQEAAERAFS